MRQFTYVIKNAYIIHFGPAGRMAELARHYPDTTATLEMGTRSADINKPLKVAGMGVRNGDPLRWSCWTCCTSTSRSICNISPHPGCSRGALPCPDRCGCLPQV